MIAPDRGRVELDLHDEKPPLLLWYPHLAIAALEERLGVDLPYSESQKLLVDLLTPKALVAFVWAGRLWQDENIRPESLRMRIGLSHRPQLEVISVVRRAIILGLSGTDTDKEEAAAEPDPPKPAAMNGAGVELSATPLAN